MSSYQPKTFGRFTEIKALWYGPNAFYPSENSARFQLRKLKPRLVSLKAAIKHAGKIYVDLDLYVEAAEQEALNAYSADDLVGAA